MLQLNLLEGVQHQIGISGKDSLATALFQTTYKPNIDYQFFFNDVGSELPETYKWLDSIERKTGWKIHRIGESLEEIIVHYGGYLPSPLARYCTRQAKIQPLEKHQKGQPTYLYLGLRADEDRGGFIPPNANIYPIYPLKEAGITLPMVWVMLEKADLLPPQFFWERLYNAVCERVDPSEWEHRLQPWQRFQLFAGRSRNNCYFCFFQRLYEWVWLLETHPDLFWKSASFEKSDYHWNSNKSLKEIAEPKERERIFQNHVNKIVKVLTSKEKMESDNPISLTSCGMLCGK